MLTRPLRPAVFLDRDGVLNVDTGYLHRSADLQWVEGAREAVRLCNERGRLVFVVTNQAGIARGYYDEAHVHELHRWMAERLAEAGARIDAFEYCPHHPEGAREEYRGPCACRKPEAGMIRSLMERFPVDPARSFMIGDRETDVAAAKAAGIPGHLFPGGNLLDFMTPLLDGIAG